MTLKQQKFINRDYIDEYLREHPCLDCGEEDILVLDFDHVSGVKCGNVSTLSHKGVSLEVLKVEIAKCEVRCANCHRRITRLRERGLEL